MSSVCINTKVVLPLLLDGWTRRALKVFGCLVPRVASGEFVRVPELWVNRTWLAIIYIDGDHLQGALTWLRVTGFAIPHSFTPIVFLVSNAALLVTPYRTRGRT
jgi:hypothetical protein